MRKFQEKSYAQHAEHFRAYGSGGEKENLAKTWFETDTVDAWRHQRMYRTLDPILAAEPKARWLTVGDGRYGRDAKYIIGKGGEALATDISDILLKEAVDIGYISKYQIENAESLSFADSEFDYVFCKEAYHHFPRPMIALYEMLRVASKGVFLIEPNDLYIYERASEVFYKFAKNPVKSLLGREPHRPNFEESGNYSYPISKREIEKAALGLNYQMIAFKGLNDAYLQGVEYEKISANGPLQRKIKKAIHTANFFCKIGLRHYGLLAAIILKKEPSKELHRQLTNEGFEIIRLLENPYIAAG